MVNNTNICVCGLFGLNRSTIEDYIMHLKTEKKTLDTIKAIK